MKILITGIFAIGFGINSFAQDKVDTLVVKTEIICDHCLECESCGANLNSALYVSGGIKEVSIDTAAETITVYYKVNKTNPETIRAAICNAGYSADGTAPSSEALQKLDGCCRGTE